VWGYNSMPVRECDRKPLYSVEITSGAIIVCLYVNVTANHYIVWR
jgi:hypothetical protein